MDVLRAELVMREKRRNCSDFDENLQRFAENGGGLSRNPGRQLLVWADDFVIADDQHGEVSRTFPKEPERFGLKSVARLASGLLLGDKP